MSRRKRLGVLARRVARGLKTAAPYMELLTLILTPVVAFISKK
ncbi:hypothetical protein AB0A77_02050 [Streptomyces varsoviensis]